MIDNALDNIGPFLDWVAVQVFNRVALARNFPGVKAQGPRFELSLSGSERGLRGLLDDGTHTFLVTFPLAGCRLWLRDVLLSLWVVAARPFSVQVVIDDGY